ncbi:hypothetical protein GCM10011332_31270 [Terasakiella brassicae]|uniref:Uncharacterized protein n=1 Tax=Terasakiella brassicae TaxID=1634917 RepID=A0A917C7Y3_9PROT|nr:hypothetical protein [Terasakiella brassicae]GGF74966.1 hypothetical protein GCM10011332_31270 [Terasakiella brassicae]
MGFDYQTLDELYRPLLEYIQQDQTRSYTVSEGQIKYFDKTSKTYVNVKNHAFSKSWAVDFIHKLQELYHFPRPVEDSAFYLPCYGLLYPSVYLYDNSKPDLFLTSPICNNTSLALQLFENSSGYGLSSGIDNSGIEALVCRLRQLKSFSFYGEQAYPDVIKEAAYEAAIIAYKIFLKSAGWAIPFLAEYDEDRQFQSLSIDEKRHLIISALKPFIDCNMGKEAIPVQSSLRELIDALNKARNGELSNILRPTQKFRKKQEDILDHYFSKIMQSMFILHLTGIEESAIRKTVLAALDISSKNFNDFQKRVLENISTDISFFDKRHGGTKGSKKHLDNLRLPKEKISTGTLHLWIDAVTDYFSATETDNNEINKGSENYSIPINYKDLLELEISEVRLKSENLFNWCIHWVSLKNSTEICQNSKDTNNKIRKKLQDGTWTEKTSPRNTPI